MSQPPSRGVILIAVGDELLGGFTLDTNSHWLAVTLREAGWTVLRIEVVADAEDAIVDAVQRAVADPRALRVVVSGGLGPTPDDRTLEAVARAVDRPLEVHPGALAHVEALMERMRAAGWTDTAEISAANRKMTHAPRGSRVLENRRGMASGIVVPLGPAPGAEGDDGDRVLLLLPGVPRELQAIVAEEAVPRVFAGGRRRTVVEVRYRNAIEAHFTEPMEELGALFPDVSVGSYPQTELRELVIRLRGDDQSRVRAAVDRLVEMRPLPADSPPPLEA